MVRYALKVGNLQAAREAVQLTPSDADAHFADAGVWSLYNPPDESVTEMENAAALRPVDYTLWMQLGLFRDQLGQTSAALSAFDEAVRRAPFYARPRWLRGNLLLRAGQFEAAFKDLDQAAESNPELVPSLIDLAWSLSNGDAKLAEQLVQVKTGKMRIAFAKFLARQGKGKEAIEQFRAAGSVDEDIRRDLVAQLLAKGAFTEAFEIWKAGREPASGKDETSPWIHDGGFEGPLTFDAVGFGWRVPLSLPAVTISLDSGHPQTGAKSLRIDFGGDSNPGTPLLSQLMLVQPSSRYKINFAARPQDIVSGGLPLAIVTDAAGEKKTLGKSAPVSKGSGDWQSFSFEFVTLPTTTAVVLSLQRESCTTSPCPIFGSVAVDSFSVEQLK